VKASVYTVNPECPSQEAVRAAVDALREGGLVVYPTDTLYGLGADPWNPHAVEKVFKAKERKRDKPLPLIIAEAHYALRLVKPSSSFWRLALAFWPGPLTIVAEASDEAPHYLAWEGMIGVRLPDSIVARLLARAIGGVIIATSANKSGMPPPRTAQDAMSMLGESVSVYLDGGPTPLGVPSTVVIIRNDSVEILREGAIPARDVARALRG